MIFKIKHDTKKTEETSKYQGQNYYKQQKLNIYSIISRIFIVVTV